jgi:hypothetical protein
MHEADSRCMLNLSNKTSLEKRKMMEMNKAAIEANKRLAAERNIYQAGQPARESHETLKEIKFLLSDILEILRKNNDR